MMSFFVSQKHVQKQRNNEKVKGALVVFSPKIDIIGKIMDQEKEDHWLKNVANLESTPNDTYVAGEKSNKALVGPNYVEGIDTWKMCPLAWRTLEEIVFYMIKVG